MLEAVWGRVCENREGEWVSERKAGRGDGILYIYIERETDIRGEWDMPGWWKIGGRREIGEE